MNKVKKIRMISSMVLFVFVMTFLPIQTEAKDKIYLNRTKITLNVGQTKKLSLIRNKKYEQAAAAVVTNPLSLHKVEAEDNDDVYYLESTNEFVIVSTDGYIRTYFKPDKGKVYFDQQ